MREYTILVGSYAPAQAQGIHLFHLRADPLRLEPAGGQSGISNPSYLAASADGSLVYAVMEDMEFDGQFGGGAAAFRRRGDRLEPLDRLPTGGTLPCHLLLDEPNRALYVSNYLSGSLSMFRLAADGSLAGRTDLDRHAGRGPDPDRQEGPHAHFAGFAPDGRGGTLPCPAAPARGTLRCCPAAPAGCMLSASLARKYTRWNRPPAAGGSPGGSPPWRAMCRAAPARRSRRRRTGGSCMPPTAGTTASR